MTPFRRGPARAVADVTQGMLLATIDIAAPPERVFRAVTSEELTRWWGSEDTYRTTAWRGDVRVGGTWQTEGVGASGKPFSVRGEFSSSIRRKSLCKPGATTGIRTTASRPSLGASTLSRVARG